MRGPWRRHFAREKDSHGRSIEATTHAHRWITFERGGHPAWTSGTTPSVANPRRHQRNAQAQASSGSHRGLRLTIKRAINGHVHPLLWCIVTSERFWQIAVGTVFENRMSSRLRSKLSLDNLRPACLDTTRSTWAREARPKEFQWLAATMAMCASRRNS